MFLFKMKIKPTWEDISEIRSFITYMLAKNGINETGLEKVAIAVSELLSNACKYSILPNVILEIKLNDFPSIIFINIKNITSKKNKDEFLKIYRMIKKDNPKEVYKKMMRRSLELDNISQLGLSRIQYECSTHLSFKIIKNLKKCFEEINFTKQLKKMLILSIDLIIILGDNE